MQSVYIVPFCNIMHITRKIIQHFRLFLVLDICDALLKNLAV